MKKIFLIIILCLSNMFIFYSRDKEVSIEKIDINLQFNEQLSNEYDANAK